MSWIKRIFNLFFCIFVVEVPYFLIHDFYNVFTQLFIFDCFDWAIILFLSLIVLLILRSYLKSLQISKPISHCDWCFIRYFPSRLWLRFKRFLGCLLPVFDWNNLLSGLNSFTWRLDAFSSVCLDLLCSNILFSYTLSLRFPSWWDWLVSFGSLLAKNRHSLIHFIGWVAFSENSLFNVTIAVFPCRIILNCFFVGIVCLDRLLFLRGFLVSIIHFKK